MIYIRTCSREVGGREESVARALGRGAGSIYNYIYVHAVGRWVGERRQWHRHQGAQQVVGRCAERRLWRMRIHKIRESAIDCSWRLH